MCHDDIFTFGPSQLDKGLAGRTTMVAIFYMVHIDVSLGIANPYYQTAKKHMNKDPSIEHKLWASISCRSAMCYTQRHLRVIFIFVCPCIGLGCSTQKTTDSITCALWQAACSCVLIACFSGHELCSEDWSSAFMVYNEKLWNWIQHMGSSTLDDSAWQEQWQSCLNWQGVIYNSHGQNGMDSVVSRIFTTCQQTLCFSAGMMCLTSRIYQT